VFFVVCRVQQRKDKEVVEGKLERRKRRQREDIGKTGEKATGSRNH
jgi:hypothetical protein